MMGLWLVLYLAGVYVVVPLLVVAFAAILVRVFIKILLWGS